MGYSRQIAGREFRTQSVEFAQHRFLPKSRGFDNTGLPQEQNLGAPHRMDNLATIGGLPIQRVRTKGDTLRRKNFSQKTRRKIALRAGEHRRHIISHHLMMNGLKSWHRVNKGKGGFSAARLQRILDKLNNHEANLIPGPGNVNSAIGMIAHQVESSDFQGSSPQQISASLSQPRGFQQNTQRGLMQGPLQVFQHDPSISTSGSEAREFARDIGDSADFDWPGGTPQEFNRWASVRREFLELQENPKQFNSLRLKRLKRKFMKLKRPGGTH